MVRGRAAGGPGGPGGRGCMYGAIGYIAGDSNSCRADERAW